MVAIKWHAPRKLSKFAGSAPLAAQLQLERFPTRPPWVSQRWNGHARNSLEPETRRRDAEKTLENVVRFFGEQHHPSSIQQHTFQHLSGGGLYRFTAQITIFWSKNTANPRHISGSTLGRCSYRWCAIPRQRRKVQGEAQRSDVCWVINPTNTNSFD